MKIVSLSVFVFLICQCKSTDTISELSNDDSDVVIAFGSCNKQNQPQILWDDILLNKPDTWIWLGDNIYGDSSDPAIMKAKYNTQKSNLDYTDLRSKTPVFGIWDDHDYGINDGGKEFKAKSEMRDLMLNFLDVPQSNEVWARKGGYQSYNLNIKNLSIKLILLDSRYFRDKPIKNGSGYDANLEGTILGEEQWIWLENEIVTSSADICIIGNGIQVIPEEHRFEKWANFPNERSKLLTLIKSKSATKTILLSGDRHITEVSKIELVNSLYEITCSGMTHTYSSFTGESNKYRIGNVVTKKNFGLLKLKMEHGVVNAVFESRGDENVIYERIVLN